MKYYFELHKFKQVFHNAIKAIISSSMRFLTENMRMTIIIDNKVSLNDMINIKPTEIRKNIFEYSSIQQQKFILEYSDSPKR
jgi:hypothetical protein